MAVAAYSAMVSLMQILDNIQLPARRHLHFHKHQIETLRETISFLVDLFEDYSTDVCHTDNDALMRLITHIANEAEDVIDSHVVDQLTQRYEDNADMVLSSFSEDIARITQKFEQMKEQLSDHKEQYWSSQEQPPSVSVPGPGSSALPSRGKNTMVGFDEHLVRIMDQLTGDESSLQIVPIVGMGGIGKTTLATNVFENPCIVERFDMRIWLTISQKYSVQEILQGLLGGKGELGNKKNKEDIGELGEKLHKKLFGRRYLIVMDDVWSTQVWDKLKFFFPKNSNRSRVIVTTRLSSVADFLGYHNSYLLDFLDEDKSWILLCQKIFGEKGCPDPEFEEIGKNIAKNCRGLPLAIVVIGGLLSNSNMKREYWEKVAENVNSFVNSGDDERCLYILSLSYSHLPIHLKPCFLYMRVFPENHKIRVSQLIRSWVAEGFVRSKREKTLEEVAYEYLKDLIDRNLILTSELGYRGNVKRCKIHDVLRDLCFIEHQKKNHLFHIAKVQMRESTVSRNFCFLCSDRYASTWVEVPRVPDASQPTSFIGCFVCDVCGMICPQLNTLRLVKVKDKSEGGYEMFPQSTKLRYLAFTVRYRLVSTSLRLLWSLQSLIVDANHLIDLPCEIWEMPQLRHVKISNATFHNPPVWKDLIVLESLQTLCCITNFKCSEEVLERIPNLKNLKIHYLETGHNWSGYLLCNLARLLKLESLTFILLTDHRRSIRSKGFNLEEIAFPHSLKKLVLGTWEFPWEKMTIIGMLPSLEVLKLQDNAFKGEEWNPVEGQFLQLKLLSIRCTDLVQWNAEKEHFPKLEKLIVQWAEYLQEIPSGIGEIETLCSIHLYNCSDSAVDSAKEIIEAQRSYGNEDLQLQVEKRNIYFFDEGQKDKAILEGTRTAIRPTFRMNMANWQRVTPPADQ